MATTVKKIDSTGNYFISGEFNEIGNSPSTIGSILFSTGQKLATQQNVTFLVNGDFTAEAWINLPNAETGGPFPIFSNNTGPLFNFRYYLNNFQITFNTYSASITSIPETTGSIRSNEWFHVAMVRYGNGYNNVSIYVNGELKGQTTYVGTLGYDGLPLYIGSAQITADLLTGYMSNVRIVNGTAVYTTNFIPSRTPLTNIPNTFLLLNTSYTNDAFVDSSVNNFTLAKTGTPLSTPQNPFNPDGYHSVLFNGTTQYLLLPANNSNLTVGTDDFTFECWAYLTVNQAACMICLSQFRIEFGNSTNISVVQNGVVVLTNSTIPSVLNTWTHVAVTRTGGILYVFINGGLIISLADSTNFTGTLPNTIGVESNSLITL